MKFHLQGEDLTIATLLGLMVVVVVYDLLRRRDRKRWIRELRNLRRPW